jgi:hypothetical protein
VGLGDEQRRDVADHLLACGRLQREVGGVRVDHPHPLVANHHHVGRDIEDRAVLLLAHAQRMLGTLALGDVARHVQHVRPAVVGHRHAVHLGLVRRAVTTACLELEAQVLAGQHAAVLALPALVFRRGDGQHAARAQRLGPRVAAHRRVRGIDVDDLEVGVAQHHRVGRRVEDLAVAAFAVAQRLLGTLALELAGGTRGEDLQQRLGQRAVDDRPAVERDDHAELAPVAADQRITRVAVEALDAEHRAGRELVVDAARDQPRRLVDEVPARGDGDVVVEVGDAAAVDAYRACAHPALGVVDVLADQRGVDVEDLRQRQHEVLVHAAGAGVRHGHCRGRGALEHRAQAALEGLGGVGLGLHGWPRSSMGRGQCRQVRRRRARDYATETRQHDGNTPMRERQRPDTAAP